jgi:hypothetical protein
MSLCPVCRQPLADPPERFCPSCGTDLTVNAPIPDTPTAEPPAIPPPLEPPPPPQPPAGDTPWDRRSQLGFIPALFETTKQVLASPTQFFQTMPVTGGLGSPLVYALIVGYIGVLATAIYATVFWSVMGTAIPTFGRRGELDQLLPLVQGGAGLVWQIVIGPIRVLFVLFLLSGIFHLVLLMFGNARRGFEATFRVVSFGHATAILYLLPFCGTVVAPIYLMVVAIIGLSEAHGISRGAAAAAVLIPIVVVCCCCTGAVVAFMGMLGGLAGILGHGR